MPPVHVSAPEFIRRLKDAQEGQVYAEFESRPDVVIRLFVTRPKESAGEFIAPEGSVFESNEAFWAFYNEIRDLTDPPEEGARNRTVKKKTMANSDLTLNDREILPMVSFRFGVSISEEEAKKLLDDGYLVKFFQEKENEKDTYYLVVNVGAKERETFRMAMLETAGRGDVVISPQPWSVGNRSGTKAYVRSFTVRDQNGEIIA